MLNQDRIRYLAKTGRLQELSKRYKEVSSPELKACLKELNALFTQGEFEITRYLDRKSRKKGSCTGDCCN